MSRKGAAGDGSAILTKSACSKLYRAHALAEYHPSAKTLHGQRPNYTFLVPAMTDKWSDRPLSGNSAFNWGTGEPKPSFLDLISGVPQRLPGPKIQARFCTPGTRLFPQSSLRSTSTEASTTYSRARHTKWWTGLLTRLLTRAGQGDCPFSLPQSKAKQRERKRGATTQSLCNSTQSSSASVFELRAGRGYVAVGAHWLA